MPRESSPIRRRVHNFMKHLPGRSLNSSNNNGDEEENPFADPVNPFIDSPTITELIEAELAVFTQIVSDLSNRPQDITMFEIDSELDLRLDLVKNGGKSKDRIAKMLRKKVVVSDLLARIDVQRQRFKDVKRLLRLGDL